MLRDAGHFVDERLGLSPAELLKAIPDTDALIIRSATRVTADVLAAAPGLVVVGRAGIGLDNVDVAAATGRGVMVVNAPQSNILSAAEHTMALLLAQARNIPQAHAALVAGKWERSRWEGVELHGKTLGVVGLGRVGALVAQRALAFGMRLVAYDPYVSPERARQMGVELLDLEDVVRQSDFLTIHLPKTPETIGLIGADLLAKAKPDLRIDQHGPRRHRRRGGAGRRHPGRPHRRRRARRVRGGADHRVAPVRAGLRGGRPRTSGASTKEAQDKAGVTIAEQVGLALAGDFVPFAVNVGAAEASETVRPFLPLAERLGRFFASLARAGGLAPVLEIEYQGPLADYDTRILTLSVLKGLLQAATDEPVSYVNAPQLAAERGLEVRTTTASSSHDYVNLVTLRGGDHALAGTLFGLRAEPRIVMVDDHDIELPIARSMLIVRNDDRVGMVALVAAILRDAGLNIVDLKLGRSRTGGTAMMALSFDHPVPAKVVDALLAAPGILDAIAITEP